MSTIKFLGASGTVTGSCYVICSDSGTQIMIDCGMFQGSHYLTKLNYETIDIDILKLDGIILTHAHLDHSGRLPLLVKNGYKGPIYATEATIDLTNLVLLDTAKIAKENRDRSPLYSETDAEFTVQAMKPVAYHQEVKIKDITIIFRDAGHIMGSSSIEIYMEGKKVVFSGDLGNYPEDLLAPTEMIDRADTVVMEATYGDRIHSSQDIRQILTNEISAVERTNGTLLIPAFSIERTQELLHILDHLKRERQILPETLVYLDSPMAIKATEIYKKYRSLYSKELQQHVTTDDPFDFPSLHLVTHAEESRNIWQTAGAKVIIAGSGMLNGGRIVRHLQNYLPMPITRLLFVGFQAQDTLGFRLMAKPKIIKIHGQTIEVRATINKCSSLSAHADQPKLLRWLNAMSGVKQIFLVHAEDKSREVFAKLINGAVLPKLHDVRNLF
ncbi:MAG: MBL fold metallo-hydrolase [Patescibacteria group bacterium]